MISQLLLLCVEIITCDCLLILDKYTFKLAHLSGADAVGVVVHGGSQLQQLRRAARRVRSDLRTFSKMLLA